MTTIKHLWAIGFEEPGRAEEVRNKITELGWGSHDLALDDVAVVVRHPDGSFTLDRQPLAAAEYFLHCAAVGFLTGVALAMPITGVTAGSVVGATDLAVSAALGIHKDFIREVEGMMKPGTSALFLLDEGGNMDKILSSIRGLGGTVLKTNVDVDRAKLIQSNLSAASADPIAPDDR